MKRLYTLLGASFLGAIASLTAQNPQPLTLSQAIEIGVQKSYAIQVANKNIDIARNNNAWGEAGAFPTVTANIVSNNTYSNVNNPTSFLNGAKMLNSGTTGTLDATWVIFEGNKMWLNKQRLELLVAQQDGTMRVALENSVQQVMKAYFNALIQQKRLQLNAELLNLSREKIRYIETRREYGQALEFDRLQVQDAYLNDSIQWVIQNNAYQVALQNLAIAMNLTPDQAQTFALADTLAYQMPTYQIDELKTRLLSTNQTLQNLKLSERVAGNQLSLQYVARYPKVSVSTGISDQLTAAKITGLPSRSEDWGHGTTFSGYVNFSVSYTLFNGGKITRSIQNATLSQQIAQLQIKDQERLLTQQFQTNIFRYDNQRNVVNLSQMLVDNARKNLTIAEERFKSNTLNYFDLRTVQMNYIRSVNSLQDAFINAKNIEIDLLLSVGEFLK